jgi:hypothetical protein
MLAIGGAGCDELRCWEWYWRSVAVRSIELIRFFTDPKGKPAEEVVGIARHYPLNQAHSEIWTALVAGTYRLQFSTTTAPNKCSLRGVVTVNVKP